MNYEKKAKEKLETIEGLLKDQKKEIETASNDMLEKIRQLPDEDPNKKKFNDIRNRILKAGAVKDRKELKKILQEIKNFT